MSWQISVQPRAERDLWDAADWYNRKQSALGMEFVACAAAAFDLIETSADRFPFYVDDLRRVLVRRFPYKIFYRISGDRALIVRVLHNAQDHRGAFDEE